MRKTTEKEINPVGQEGRHKNRKERNRNESGIGKMAQQWLSEKSVIEEKLLVYLDENEMIADSIDYARSVGIDHEV